MESWQELAAEVRRRAGTDTLDQVGVAAALADESAARADAVLDHFICAAREAGVSWTEIGARLGVSKQAVRQRYADRMPGPGTADQVALRPRLQACLDRAQQLAEAEGAAEVGTDHLLAGLLAEGVAAAVLERLGVTTEAVRASAARLFGPVARPAGGGPPARSAEAEAAVEAAARQARTHPAAPGCVQVGTEHLLLVLALDPGSRARRVLVDLGTDIAAIKRELACYVGGSTRPIRRSRRLRRVLPG